MFMIWHSRHPPMDSVERELIEVSLRRWRGLYLAVSYDRLRLLSNCFGALNAVVVRRATKLDAQFASRAKRRGWWAWRAHTARRHAQNSLVSDASTLRELHTLLRSWRAWRAATALFKRERCATRLQALHRRKVVSARVDEVRARRRAHGGPFPANPLIHAPSPSRMAISGASVRQPRSLAEVVGGLESVRPPQVSSGTGPSNSSRTQAARETQESVGEVAKRRALVRWHALLVRRAHMELAQRHSAKAAGARALVVWHSSIARSTRAWAPLASGVHTAPKETTRRRPAGEDGGFFCVSSDSDEPA